MSRLEVHHLFPRSILYKHGYSRSEVNALANFCFLTRECNLAISNRDPEKYFPEMETANPGVLRSQWIPTDPELWKVKNYRAFLEARKALLSDALNEALEGLLHGDLRWLAGTATVAPAEPELVGAAPSPGVEALSRWENPAPHGTSWM